MAKDSNATWFDVEVGSLSVEQQAAYEAYKTAQRQAAELRTKFETLVNKDMATKIGAGRKLVFGYRFGKLSTAVVEDDKPTQGSKAKLSLTQFLAEQNASGRRV